MKEATRKFDLPTTGGSIHFSSATPDRTVDVEEKKEKRDVLRLVIPPNLNGRPIAAHLASVRAGTLELNTNSKDLGFTHG